MADFADDELPLPSFVEVFGDGHPDMILVANNAAAARRRLANKRAGARMGVGDESSGRWTPEEQKLFLEGLMLYGKDWKKMAPLIKTRTLVQIRTHAQKVFKKMGLKMLDRSRRKRGLDEDDEIDEERLDQLKLSGQLEGMIASGELNVGDGDENERLRVNALGAVHHPNAHLNPQASAVRLPAVGIGNPHSEQQSGAATSSGSAGNSAASDDGSRFAVSAPVSGPAPSVFGAAATHAGAGPPPTQGIAMQQGMPGSAQMMQQQSPYMLPGGVQAPPYHQLQMMQQQVALQQQQQQEYLRQQQQFLMHQQMQQDEYHRQQQQRYQQHLNSSAAGQQYAAPGSQPPQQKH